MPRIGEQGDVLRAVGRILDEENATAVEILNQDSFISVSWETEAFGSGVRSYREPQLATLRAQAKFLRGGGVPGANREDSFTELLRTLGQELDDARMEMVGITQVPNGFRVSAVRNRIYEKHVVYLSELRKASALHRLKRGTGIDHKAHELDPFFGVAVGMPVLTRDNQQIGKVGDVQGRSFKIKGQRLQRDFWLPGSLVMSVRTGKEVRLSVDKAALDKQKRDRPVEDGTTMFDMGPAV